MFPCEQLKVPGREPGNWLQAQPFHDMETLYSAEVRGEKRHSTTDVEPRKQSLEKRHRHWRWTSVWLLSLIHSFWRSENRVEAWNKFPWRVQIRARDLKWGAAQLPPQTPGWFLLPGVGSNITSVSQSKDRGFRDTDLVTYQRTESPILESKKKNGVILCFKTMKIFLLQFFLIIQYEQLLYI